MNDPDRAGDHPPLWGHPLVVAGTLVFAAFLIRWNFDVSFMDEGYLWSGADAVLHGKIPLLDFQSYDPGRYYWCAAFGKLFGPGLLTLRFACAVFQWIGLGAALFFLRPRPSLPETWLGAALLVLWMYPPFKVFESASALLICVLADRLLREDGWRPWVLMGAVLGAVSFFGRNFAFYGALTTAILWFYRRGVRRDISFGPLAYSAGAALFIGLIPILILSLGARGFASAWAGYFLQHNLGVPLPIPWPWLAPFSHPFSPQGPLGFPFLFLFTPLLCALILILTFSGRRSFEAFLPAAATSAPLLHYTFFRSDAAHLCVAVMPFFLILYRSSKPILRWGLWTGALLFTLLDLVPTSNFPAYLFNQNAWPDRAVFLGQEVRLTREQSTLIDALKSELRKEPNGQVVAFMPYLPGFYPALGLPSPLWLLYPTYRAFPGDEERAVRELEEGRVTRIFFWNCQITGIPPIELSTTHPRLFRYIQSHYVIHSVPAFEPKYHWLMRSRPFEPTP